MNKKIKNDYFIALTGVFAALSIIIYMFFPEIPIVPGISYLKIDFSDVPALIVSFTAGPLAGIMVEIIKNLVHLTKTTTFGIGEVMNVIIGSSVILSMYFCIKILSAKTKLKSNIKYIIASTITVAVIILTGYFSNAIFVPIYLRLIGVPFSAKGYFAAIFGSTLLNLVKGLVMVIISFPLINSLSKLTSKIN